MEHPVQETYIINTVPKRMIVRCDRYCIHCCGFIAKCEKRLIKLSVAIFNKSDFISARNLISLLRCFSDKNCYFCRFLSLLRDGESNCSARWPHCWSCFEREVGTSWSKNVHWISSAYIYYRRYCYSPSCVIDDSRTQSNGGVVIWDDILVDDINSRNYLWQSN